MMSQPQGINLKVGHYWLTTG